MIKRHYETHFPAHIAVDLGVGCELKHSNGGPHGPSDEMNIEGFKFRARLVWMDSNCCDDRNPLGANLLRHRYTLTAVCQTVGRRSHLLGGAPAFRSGPKWTEDAGYRHT